MNYSEAIAYMSEIPKFGKKDGIENMKRLLDKMNHPEKEMKIIHVAGTNGKGSVCAYTTSILKTAGYQVGMFISPHLVKYNERIQLNGSPVSDEIFVNAWQTVKEKCMLLAEEGYGHPTFFEFILAMALFIFQQNKMEFVVLETGIGGRLDATNVIEKPLISVITSIGLDHTEILGETIKEIAYEKAGIIKRECPVVSLCRNNEIKECLTRVSNEKNAKLYLVEEIEYKILKTLNKGIDFSLNTRYYKYDRIHTTINAYYAIENVALTLLLFKALEEEGISLKEIDLLQGIGTTIWPGRMEIIQPHILIDGAHNEAGMNEFTRNIELFYPNKTLVLLFGCVKDKPYQKMIEHLCQSLQFEHIIITEPLTPKAVLATDLLEVFQKYQQAHLWLEKDYIKALQLGRRLVDEEGLLCCIGSLYLIGPIRHHLKEEDLID